MNEKSSSMQWYEQWVQAQRAYWDVWKSLMRFTPRSDAANPWSQALETWGKAVSGSVGGDGDLLFGRLLEQSRNFFGMGQQMNDLFRAASDSANAGDKWQEALRTRFDVMKSSIAQSSEWADSMKRMTSFMEMPMDTWRRMMSGATIMPGDFLQTLRSQVWEGAGEKFHGGVDKFLSVPGVGYTREAQEQLQLTARLAIEYQKAAQEYIDAHLKVNADALDRLYKKIVALTERGERITTLRQMYDLWVDASEEVYGDFAMSTEFQEIYGRVVNALMRLKLQSRHFIDEMLGAFNMPTRTEMNTIIKRQHELKRELRALKHTFEESTPPPKGGRETRDESRAEVSRLRNEMSSLREQVLALQAALDDQRFAAATAQASNVEPIRKPRGAPTLRTVRTAKAETPAKTARVVRTKPRAQRRDWDIGAIVEDGNPKPATPRRGKR